MGHPDDHPRPPGPKTVVAVPTTGTKPAPQRIPTPTHTKHMGTRRRKNARTTRCTTCDGYGTHPNNHTCTTCVGTGTTPSAPLHTQRRKKGQPTLISTHGPDILTLIRKGMDDTSAATRVGISPRTLERWLANGHDAATLEAEGYKLDAGRAATRAFLSDYLRAREDLHERLLNVVDDKLKSMDAVDALKFLERMRRKKWGRVDTVQVQGDGSPGSAIPFTDRYQETLTELLRNIIADLRLTPDQLVRVPEIIERNLARVSAREQV